MSSDIQSTFISAAVASATVVAASQQKTAGTPLTLTASPYVMDAARKLTVSSGQNINAVNFTVVGLDHIGAAATEVITGVNANAVTSTVYWSSITSITPDANVNGANSASAGTSNSVAAAIFSGPLRLKGIYAVNTATAGTITFRETSPTGAIRMQFATVGSATTSEYPDVPDDGILFKAGGYIDYSPVSMSSITVFYA
jgi:hypothetical protein|tara:strand:+ start:1239 stop:1835 length:597 start_codon:yes stop_codon:yes gene_type:complete